MATWKICVVEDDAQDARNLQEFLCRYAKEMDVSLAVSWLSSAVEFVDRRRDFDLVFMDIQLPGINGMEAAEWLRTFDDTTLLIFVTNLAQYAVRGYSVGALDFVLKPVRYMDFKIRMDRALRMLVRREDRRIYFSTRDGANVIPASELLFADVLDHDLAYHLVDGRVVTARRSLKALEEELAGSTFVRISKSTIVNMRHIRQIKGSELLLANGNSVFISRGMKASALATIANYFGGNS